jgi:hypothetical protein
MLKKVFPVMLMAGGLALSLGCASPGLPAGSEPAGAASKPEARRDAAPAARDPYKVEPPDGKWSVDELGRRYFLLEVPKQEGRYLVDRPAKKVTLWGTPPFDFERETAGAFFVKVYDTEVPLAPASTPSPPPKARVAGESAPAVDRLSFRSFGKGLPNSGQWRQGFEVIDFDGDGHLDIVHGPVRKQRGVPVVFYGDGAGGWRRQAIEALAREELDYGDVAVRDFNRDGRLDLAFASHLRGFRVFVGDGQGGYRRWDRGLPFQVAGRGESGPVFTSRAIEALDWDGDGLQDLVALSEGPNLAASAGQPSQPGQVRAFNYGVRGIVVFLNQGDGSWKALNLDSANHFGDDFAVGDFDGDGALDVVLAVPRQGDRRLWIRGGPEGGSKLEELSGLDPATQVLAVASADLDRDGRPELVGSYLSYDEERQKWRSGIDVFSWKDGRWNRTPVWNAETRVTIGALDVGDLDADGRFDVVGLTGDGRTLIFLGAGGGRFHQEKTPEIEPVGRSCRGYFVRLADLDDDGVPEVFEEFAGEESGDPFGLTPNECTSEGALRVWKASRVNPAAGG